MNFRFLLLLPLFLLFCLASFSQVSLKQDRELPILAWLGVPERESTLERFKEIKEAGFTINFANYSSLSAAKQALDLAQQVGMKVLVSCPELKSEPEKTVRQIMKHPALAGYYIRDEPGATEFNDLATLVNRIKAVDDLHFCYINLFPNYASTEQLLGKGTPPMAEKEAYQEYLERFLREVPVPFLSFDHYPLIEGKNGRGVRGNWYQNLEMIVEAAQKKDIPVWAFALAVAHQPYPIPTLGELRLQMYTNLAYGAQGLQYFTYWTPRLNKNWDFHDAPIGHDGKRTVVYDRVKAMNKELQNQAAVFVGAKVVWVKQTGKFIPMGTKRLDKLPDPIKVLETDETGAVVSLLENEDQYILMIVNRDFENSMQLVLAAEDRVDKILKDGTVVKANSYSNLIEVDPGDAVIYTWKK